MNKRLLKQEILLQKFFSSKKQPFLSGEFCSKIVLKSSNFIEISFKFY